MPDTRYGIDTADSGRTKSIASLSSRDDIVWVDDPDVGSQFALLQVEPFSGLWVVRSRFQPGTIIQSHLHSGYVTATTVSGRWQYPEMDTWCESGDYLVELSGTVHSLQVTTDQPAEIQFAILGSITYFDSSGTVERIEDWKSVLAFYRRQCATIGRVARVLGAQEDAAATN